MMTLTRVSQAAIERLRQALPDLRIKIDLAPGLIRVGYRYGDHLPLACHVGSHFGR